MIRETDYRGTNPNGSKDKSVAWRLRQPVVPAIKRAARLWGMATAGRRCVPDYLIIGAKRSGSTTLARNLLAADDVLPLFPASEDRKGIYGLDVHFHRGERWYRSHFPLERTRHRAAARVESRVVVGEASPWYLHYPHAPERAAALNPHIRVIAVLRDPVDRAYSHWRERVLQGIEPVANFEEALDAETGRVAGEVDRMLADERYVSLNHLNFGYVAQGQYLAALERWRSVIGRDQMLVLSSADLFSNPGATVTRARAFLGLRDLPAVPAEHFNQLPSEPLPRSIRRRISATIGDQEVHLTRWFTHEG